MKGKTIERSNDVVGITLLRRFEVIRRHFDLTERFVQSTRFVERFRKRIAKPVLVSSKDDGEEVLRRRRRRRRRRKERLVAVLYSHFSSRSN